MEFERQDRASSTVERAGDLARAFRRFREQGDPAALTTGFDALAPELLALAGHLTRDLAEAEDLVQECFLARPIHQLVPKCAPCAVQCTSCVRSTRRRGLWSR